jgi:hypothetical protein
MDQRNLKFLIKTKTAEITIENIGKGVRQVKFQWQLLPDCMPTAQGGAFNEDKDRFLGKHNATIY